uniref:Uncharacterized protein n=1 Tax=Kalanchoe fedtschenkoi TaxID=63787 RepID=A0A7N0VAW1_KALFE
MSAGLNRCGKSCRLRWLNYLRPDIKRGNISEDEEELIIRLHKLLGNRWSLIAGRLPGRTDNEIKNYWNTTLGKKVGSEVSQRSSSKKGKMSKSKETSKAVPEPDSSTQPLTQPIRTKAFRCTKVHIPATIHSPREDYNKHEDTKPTHSQSAQQTSSPDSGEYVVDFSQFLDFGSDEFQGIDTCMGFNGQFDVPVTKDWMRSDISGLENSSMELESLGFLLDGEGWY